MKPKSNQAISRAACWLWLFLLLRILIGDALAHFPAESRGVTTAATQAERGLYLFTGEQIDPDLGMYYLRARYYQPGIGRFWNMDSFEGRQEGPLSLHKYLYCNADPMNGIDPSGNETLGSFMSSTAISGSIIGAAVGTPFRAYKAAKQFEAGVAMGDIAFDASIGVLTDATLGAVLPGIFTLGSRIAPVARVVSAGGQVVNRAVNSVWNLAPIARGRLIEQTLLGRLPSTLQAGVRNFPVIDDFFQGVATSIKSIDLFARTYQNTAALTSRIMSDAGKLAGFQGARVGGYHVAAGEIEKRVLVVAVEGGAATTAQAQALAQAVRQAQATYPNVQVIIQAIP